MVLWRLRVSWTPRTHDALLESAGAVVELEAELRARRRILARSSARKCRRAV